MITFRGSVGATAFAQKAGYIDFRLRKEVAISSENVEHDPLAWNHSFVPRDQIELFEQACSGHQIKLVRAWYQTSASLRLME
jgi:hypothetical protein